MIRPSIFFSYYVRVMEETYGHRRRHGRTKRCVVVRVHTSTVWPVSRPPPVRVIPFTLHHGTWHRSVRRMADVRVPSRRCLTTSKSPRKPITAHR